MMRLTIENHMLDMTKPGFPVAILEAAQHLRNKWPGVASHEVWFKDPVFGRYKDLQQLAAAEMMAAEEETDEHMDATALSEAVETSALSTLSAEDETGSAVPGHDLEAEHDTETGRATGERPTLPLIDIKVRP